MLTRRVGFLIRPVVELRLTRCLYLQILGQSSIQTFVVPSSSVETVRRGTGIEESFALALWEVTFSFLLPEISRDNKLPGSLHDGLSPGAV